jgi:hypothetical protein
VPSTIRAVEPCVRAQAPQKETVARRILRSREGDVEKGIPIVPQMGIIAFDGAADDLLNDYRINRKA